MVLEWLQAIGNLGLLGIAVAAVVSMICSGRRYGRSLIAWLGSGYGAAILSLLSKHLRIRPAHLRAGALTHPLLSLSPLRGSSRPRRRTRKLTLGTK